MPEQPTSVRWTEADQRILARLRELTGGGTASVLRLAMRTLLRELEAPIARRTGT